MSKIFTETSGPLFRLVERDKGVAVILVDNSGEPIAGGLVCQFTADGRLKLISGIAPELGLQLDRSGKILVI